MTTLPRSTTARQLIRALERDGWTWTRSRGSHRCYEKGDRTAVLTFHHPGDTFPPGTLASILASTAWADDDLRRLKLLK